jgi:hypothetical protein
MSGRKRFETFKRDNLLVDIIFQHKGLQNAIGTQELVHALNERGYSVKPECMHQIVTKIVFERRLPICSMVHKGYYWGTSKQDIQGAIDELQYKIQGLQERIDLLKSFIYE